VLLIVTIVNAEELTGAEIGAWIGYTVGAVLSMLAVGRVIELLQQIRDAVRNTPALSPDRSDGV
jgi:Na+/H+-translocating membrane pyrophosphatase